MTVVGCLDPLALLRGQDPAQAPEAPGMVEWGLNSGSHSPAVTEDYVISPDDELDIYVLDVSEVSRPYRVSPMLRKQIRLRRHSHTMRVFTR